MQWDTLSAEVRFGQTDFEGEISIVKMCRGRPDRATVALNITRRFMSKLRPLFPFNCHFSAKKDAERAQRN